MNKNLIFAAAAILIILGVGWYWFGQKSASVVDSTNAIVEEPSGNATIGTGGDDPYDALIEFTDDGFTPKDVTIREGQRVRFLNKSTDQQTWPASAVHPTHSLYPGKSASDCLGSEFDACRGLKGGEYFDFTFNYKGQWRFHDHLHASKTGSVTVNALE